MRSELMLVLAAVLLAASANGAYIRNAKRQKADKSDPPLVLDDNPQQMHDDIEAAKLDPPLVLNDEGNKDLPPFKRLTKKQTDNNDLPPFKRLNKKKQTDNKGLPPFKRLNKKQTDINDFPPFKRLDKKQSDINDLPPFKRLDKKQSDLADDAILSGNAADEGNRAEKRGARWNRATLWPKIGELIPIPFVIDSGMDDAHKKAIERALKEFNKKTCIRFKDRRGQPDYIKFAQKDGCHSEVGKRFGVQEVSLGSGCQYKGKVLHELMHLLSFIHEQNRADRDNSVYVYRNRVKSGYLQNFDKISGSTNVKGEYDPQSLVQYGNTAFASGSQKTIVYKPDPNLKLGNNNDFSALDLESINKLYDCSPQKNYDYENYKVTVTTASEWLTVGEGTDAYVYMQLKGKLNGKDEVSGWTDVATGGTFDDFETGMVSVYYLAFRHMEEIKDVEVQLEKRGSFDEWKLEKIVIEDPKTKKIKTCTPTGWLAPGSTIYSLPCG